MNPGTAGGGGETIVGPRCVFLANSHVAHDCRIGDGVILSNNVMLAGHCQIGDFAILERRLGGASIRAHRRACLRRRPRRRRERHHPVRHRARQSRLAGRAQFRRPEAPRLLARGDPRAAPRLQAIVRADGHAEGARRGRRARRSPTRRRCSRSSPSCARAATARSACRAKARTKWLERRPRAPLAILCGGGALALEAAPTGARNGREVFLVGMVGSASIDIEAFPHIWVQARRGRQIVRARCASAASWRWRSWARFRGPNSPTSSSIGARSSARAKSRDCSAAATTVCSRASRAYSSARGFASSASRISRRLCWRPTASSPGRAPDAETAGRHQGSARRCSARSRRSTSGRARRREWARARGRGRGGHRRDAVASCGHARLAAAAAEGPRRRVRQGRQARPGHAARPAGGGAADDRSGRARRTRGHRDRGGRRADRRARAISSTPPRPRACSSSAGPRERAAAHRAGRGRAFRRSTRLQTDARVARGDGRRGRISRRRRRGDGGRGAEEPVSDGRHRGHGHPARHRETADAGLRAFARRRRRSSPPSPTGSSSSTARISPIASRGACARRCQSCRSSIMSAPASGRGGRGGRRRCAAYVDCVLALLPFEPQAHVRLGGPRCVYVGHPLIERLDELRPDAAEAQRRAASPPLIVVLPGSRRSEIAPVDRRFRRRARWARRGDRADRVGAADAAACRERGARARRHLEGRAAHRLGRKRKNSPRSGARARRSPNPARARWNSRWRACRWSAPTRSRESKNC